MESEYVQLTGFTVMLWFAASFGACLLAMPLIYESYRDYCAVKKAGIGNGRLRYTKETLGMSVLRLLVPLLFAICAALLFIYPLPRDLHIVWAVRFTLVAPVLLLVVEGLLLWGNRIRTEREARRK